MTRILSCAICLQCSHGHRNNWKCRGVVCNPFQKRRSVTASDVIIEVLVSKLAKTISILLWLNFEVLSNPPFPQPQGRHFPVPIVSNEWFGTQVSSCIASVESDMGLFKIRCFTPRSCFKIIPQSQHPNTSCTNHLKLFIELVVERRLPHTEEQRSTRGQKNCAPKRSAPGMRACVSVRHRAPPCIIMRSTRSFAFGTKDEQVIMVSVVRAV